MADILIRGLSKWTVDRLKQRAKESGRSLQNELRMIVEREARRRSMEEAIAAAREIRAQTKPSDVSSVDLIREDRDR